MLTGLVIVVALGLAWGLVLYLRARQRALVRPRMTSVRTRRGRPGHASRSDSQGAYVPDAAGLSDCSGTADRHASFSGFGSSDPSCAGDSSSASSSDTSCSSDSPSSSSSD